MGIVSQQNSNVSHQLLRYALSSSSVAWCVCVILVRQFVHLANHFFGATQFNHGLSESCITDETIVNAQELSILKLLLELIRSVIFLIPFFLPVSVTVWSALADLKIRIEKRPSTDLTYFLFSVVSSRKK